MPTFRHRFPDTRGHTLAPLRHGLALSLALAHFSADAAGAMAVDDASVVQAKSCQLESLARKNRGNSEYLMQPACNFSGNLELTVGVVRTHDNTGTHTTNELIQGKTLFKRLETNGWGVGLAIGSGRDPQSGIGSLDWYANVPTSVSLRDDRFVLHTNVGWLLKHETRRQHLTWGFGSETQLAERTWLLAETFGQNQGKPFFQVGLRHSIVSDRVQIDATYGDRVGSTTREKWFSIGLQLTVPPFLP